jgi:FkbM family methyltransferase
MRANAFDKHLAADRLRLFDVGARGGIDPRWRPFHAYIEAIGFEPDPTECERLNREAASQSPPVRFLPHALAKGSGEVTFYEANWPPASSIYPPNDEFLEPFPYATHLLGVKGERRIDAVSLDEACRREGIWPDCLKLDVEGAELQVLEGGERASGGALVLELEVEFAPLRTGQPLFADVDAYLRSRGWSLLGLRRVHWRRSAGLDPRATGYGGQLTQADALYFNAPLLDEGLTQARALKLVLILSAYRQLDLALELLRAPAGALRELPSSDRAELERLVLNRPGLLLRLARRVSRRVDAERRRALADALQPGDATIWHDPHFF